MLAKIIQKTVILLWLHCQIIMWHADKIFLTQLPRRYFLNMRIWTLQENINLFVMQSTWDNSGKSSPLYLHKSHRTRSVPAYFLPMFHSCDPRWLLFEIRVNLWSFRIHFSLPSLLLKCQILSKIWSVFKNYNFKIYLKLFVQNCPMYKASEGNEARQSPQVGMQLLTFLAVFSSLTLVKTWMLYNFFITE